MGSAHCPPPDHTQPAPIFNTIRLPLPTSITIFSISPTALISSTYMPLLTFSTTPTAFNFSILTPVAVSFLFFSAFLTFTNFR